MLGRSKVRVGLSEGLGRPLLKSFCDEGLGVYLATGQASPPLAALGPAYGQYLLDRGRGVPAKREYDRHTLRCKKLLAERLNCSAEEVALAPTVVQAVDIVVRSLPLRPRDNIVLDELDYPSLSFPWMQARCEGVEVRFAPTAQRGQSEDVLLSVVDARTRVVCISHASSLTGFRYDLQEISQRVGPDCRVIVDASQSVGVIPLDISFIDVAVASCHKWLLGPHGIAMLAWNRARSGDMLPSVASQHSVSDYEFPLTGQWTLAGDATRYELGTQSYAGHYQLEAALEFLARFSPEGVETHVRLLTERLVEGLADQGLDVITERNWSRRAGNVSFRSESADHVVARMAEQGIQAIGGHGRVRLSPYIFNDEADVEAALESLRTLTQ